MVDVHFDKNCCNIFYQFHPVLSNQLKEKAFLSIGYYMTIQLFVNETNFWNEQQIKEFKDE